ncbi:MAG: EAL domain-containing response regulator [Pseudomonadota bacterium]
MKTLILDDDQIFLTVAKAVLGVSKISDVTATIDSGEAKNLVQTGAVELIISDLNMPGYDGFAFLKDLADASYKGALIIASGEDNTVLSSARQIARRMKLNIIGAINKPVNIKSFEALIAEAKNTKPHAKSASAKPSTTALSQLKPALVYQLQVNTFSGRISGTEALLRAVDVDGKVTGPGQLLAAADTPHAAVELTEILLDIFCAQVAILRERGCTWPFSFNLDARPFEAPGFPAILKQTISKHGLAPDDIILELTESHLPDDPSILLSAIARLRMAGFYMAMDDFSTGAASFDILRDGAFSEIKLDMDLTRSAAEVEASRAFIRNLADIAKNLGLRLVAEGIETEQERNLMESLGVRHMQGYLFAKPVGFEILPDVANRLTQKVMAAT